MFCNHGNHSYRNNQDQARLRLPLRTGRAICDQSHPGKGDSSAAGSPVRPLPGVLDRSFPVCLLPLTGCPAPPLVQVYSFLRMAPGKGILGSPWPCCARFLDQALRAYPVRVIRNPALSARVRYLILICVGLPVQPYRVSTDGVRCSHLRA